MDKLRTTLSLLMRLMRRKTMSIAKLFVGAVVETTVQMSFGLAVTSVRGGTMESV